MYAMLVFPGMAMHGFLAECLNRSPNLITAQPNYVKKVVFPLELMPCVATLSSLLHFGISLGVLMIFMVANGKVPAPSAVLIPLAILPLVLLTLGFSWLFSSLGVYLRDLAQGMGVATTILLFLSPVFYPIETLPAGFQMLIRLNPLTLPINQLRDLALLDRPVDWYAWAVSLVSGIAICYGGYWWFQRTRRGFADVL